MFRQSRLVLTILTKSLLAFAIVFYFIGSGSTVSASEVTITLETELTASDAREGGGFGGGLDISGDTMMVGAAGMGSLQDWHGNHNGAVYFLTRTEAGWVETNKVEASDAKVGDGFGVRIALDGETAAVRADGNNAVYAFESELEVAKLTPSMASLDVNGDTLVGGVQADDQAATDAGAVYVYRRIEGSWIREAKLTASDAKETQLFGCSVAISGDVLVVGAYGDTVDGNGYAGSAYVFRRYGDTWIEEAKLTSDNPARGGYFGYAVDIFGDTIVVGAHNEVNDSDEPPGAVYVFRYDGNGWIQEGRLTDEIGNYKNFGIRTCLEGDTLLVINSNQLILFQRTEGTWSEAGRGAYDYSPSELVLLVNSIFVGHRHVNNWTGVVRIYSIDPLDSTSPITADVVAEPTPVNGDVTLTATADDSTTGNSSINSAEYSLDSGDWYLMQPETGSFDEPVEYVTAMFTAPEFPGVYELCVRCTDSAGNTSNPECMFLPIYDPEGGFVTGGGWIYSEAGWCQLDEICTSAEGKANFGFVSKYKKGADIPTGNTEFQFKTGNLNFHSSTYEWLVVTGSDYAKFKGSGTINGGGDYKFMLWAGDDEPDTFRIKIWEEDEFGTETVTYDNGMDQVIGGGSIVIHNK